MDTIAVGVDRRGDADGAVRWAAALAERRHAVLRFVHAVDRGGPAGPETGSDWSVLARAQRVASTVTPLPVTRSHLSWQSPLETLASASQHADVLVVGARRGQRLPVGAQTASMGSRVAELSSCPVAVVPGGWSGGVGERVRGAGVVVCDDGTDRSSLVLDAAVALARGTDAVLTVLHCPPVRGGVAAGEQRRDEVEAPVRRLAEVVQRIQDRNPTLHIRPGSFHGAGASADLAAAAADADVVVLGGRGAAQPGQDPFGAAVEELLRAANLPVLIVPPVSRSLLPPGEREAGDEHRTASALAAGRP